jgi:uncharacterized SAM-binding protein YcdF (DUF218 family)
MFFWRKNENWEDEYDEYYTRDIERGGGKVRFKYLPHMLLLLFVGAIFCAIVGAVAGPTMLEKLLTALVMPVGILWLLLLVTIYFCLINRNAWPATMCFLCWLIMTISGNSLFSRWYAGTIERPFLSQDLSGVEPYDVIVVLGGGTSTRISGTPQVSEAGDRIVQAARVWHAGQTKQIMCTGLQAFRSTEDDKHPYEEATLLLEELGVDASDILPLNGINTSEEMKNLKKWSDLNPGKRIGILTSAWHLSRAMRLAKTQGINAEPVAAGFFSQPYAPSPGVVVPSEYNLMVTAAVTKEYLARLVGR